MCIINTVDKWQFLYWKSEKDFLDDSGWDVRARTYVGTLEHAIKKFRHFLTGREIYSIDEEVRQESTGKCFRLKDYSEDIYFDNYI